MIIRNMITKKIPYNAHTAYEFLDQKRKRFSKTNAKKNR